MDEELKNNPSFLNGYADGEHIARNMPSARKMLKTEASTPYEKGLLAGVEGYLKELSYSNDKYLPKWFKRNPDEKLTKYFNEKAKDSRPDIEPEL